MSVYLSPMSTMLQLLSDAGVVTQGYLLWTYIAGTSTPVATYTDSTGITPNGNPIQLNSAGRLPNVEIWQTSGQAVKFIFSTNAGTPSVPVFGVQVGQVYDNVQGINDVAYNTVFSTFTGILTGMTGPVNVTVSYAIVGKTCILRGTTTGTSNSTSMSMTGLPAIVTPSSGSSCCASILEDNGSQSVGGWSFVTTGNVINFGVGINNNQAGFTATGTKGLPPGWTAVYSLF